LYGTAELRKKQVRQDEVRALTNLPTGGRKRKKKRKEDKRSERLSTGYFIGSTKTPRGKEGLRKDGRGRERGGRLGLQKKQALVRLK